jgi:hypothetical protein
LGKTSARQGCKKVLNLRVSVIFAGAAFLLSFLIGFVNKSTMPILIIRPLIFAFVFFAISVSIKILVDRYLPELFEPLDPETDDIRPGSRIDITEDNSQDLPETFSSNLYRQGQPAMGAKPDDSEDALGDISELSRVSAYSRGIGGDTSRGMDQNTEDRYTDGGDLTGFKISGGEESLFGEGDFGETQINTGSSVEQSQQSRSPQKATGSGSPVFSNSDDSLPDLDSMAGAFAVTTHGGGGDENTDYSDSDIPRKPSSSKKAPEWTGDFNPKEIAMGIRTALSKDKEG